MLASALATKVSWSRPFLLAPAADLGDDSPWRASLNLVLRSRSEHEVGLFSSPIGVLGVHVASADEGLDVHSVIGPPDVPAPDVIATWLGGATEKCDVFDLDLGDGHAWSLTEADGYGATAVSSAVLPAWSSSSEFDLMDHTLGFGTAMALLNEDLPESAPLAKARQVARAEYTRTGFHAAAVTDAIALGASHRPCLATAPHPTVQPTLRRVRHRSPPPRTTNRAPQPMATRTGVLGVDHHTYRGHPQHRRRGDIRPPRGSPWPSPDGLTASSAFDDLD